jgi:hypothetical protein
VWDAILASASPSIVDFLQNEGIWAAVRRIIRFIFPAYKVINEKIHSILISLGVQSDKAREYAMDPIFSS